MKILYGLPSEGMGHATRSKVIIEHLLQHHDVQIVTSDRAFTFLEKSFPGRVHRIEGFHLAYKNAMVSISKTIFETLKKAPLSLIKNFGQYSKVIKHFDADLVISDFESFTFFYAKANQKPLISIDNMQVINRTILDIDIPESEKNNYRIAKTVIKVKVPFADHYFISSFFATEIKKKRTSFVPPIIRKEILHATTSQGENIVVYQTSSSQNDLIPILQSIPHQTFIVYGFNKYENHGNVQLKNFSEEGFIEDISAAKAVLSNGGYSFISEAIYLRKPIYSVPIDNQFEQFVNASYVEKMGYGRHKNKFSEKGILKFINQLEAYQNNLLSYQQDGNKVLFNSLDLWIDNMKKEI
jgi:uncharacterized protein (TIGR00661 family)